MFKLEKGAKGKKGDVEILHRTEKRQDKKQKGANGCKLMEGDAGNVGRSAKG